MKFIIALSLVASLAIARAESPDTSSVVVLSASPRVIFDIAICVRTSLSLRLTRPSVYAESDSFDQVVNGAKHVFVKFYAPW